MRKTNKRMQKGSFYFGSVLPIVSAMTDTTTLQEQAMSTLTTSWVRMPHVNGASRWSPSAPIITEPLAKPSPVRTKPAVDETVVSALVGHNLRRLRKQNRLSLEELSTHSGVSRAMLGQVEQGKSIPSIKTLWQVAQALGVSVSWFLDATHEAPVILMQPAVDSPFSLKVAEAELRSLQQTGDVSCDAFYELRLAPTATLRLPISPVSRRINVAVSTGVLDVVLDDERHLVRPREALQYDASHTLVWRNNGQVQVQAFVLIRAVPHVQ